MEVKKSRDILFEIELEGIQKAHPTSCTSLEPSVKMKVKFGKRWSVYLSNVCCWQGKEGCYRKIEGVCVLVNFLGFEN